MLFGVKAPEALLCGGLVGIVALAWYRRKCWQSGHLRAAQAAVPRSYSRAQIKFRGWLAAFLGVASIWVVLPVGNGTIENYKNWP